MRHHKRLRAGGFTLIEVIISMALFGMMAIVFLSVFSTSLIWIYGAGDRGEAYSAAQAQLEARLITRDVEQLPAGEGVLPDLMLSFGDDTFHIWGGLIQESQSVGRGTSELEVFAPLVPTISLEPVNTLEGTVGQVTVNITGHYTRFADASPVTVELYDNLGVTRIGNPITPTITSNSDAWFYLPANLPGADYTVKVVSTFPGDTIQTARARYSVVQSMYIAGGAGKLYVTADGSQWVDRSTFLSYPGWEGFPLITHSINAIAGNGPVRVAVGDSGMVLVGREKQQWQMHYIAAGNLTGITWSPVIGMFYAVDSSGNIHKSSDGRFWSHGGLIVGLDEVQHLTSIAAVRLVAGETQTDMMIAVGYNKYLEYFKGVIVTSSDGLTWTAKETPPGPIDDIPRGVASGDNDSMIIVVGDNGNIYTSSDGINFTHQSPLGANLTGITYAAARFAISASDGKVYTSPTGSGWTSATTAPGALNAITGRPDGTIVAVGEAGAFAIFSSDVWTVGTMPGAPSLSAVVGN